MRVLEPKWRLQSTAVDYGGAMSWEQGDRELGAGVMPEITLAIDDSIWHLCVQILKTKNDSVNQ